MQKSIYAELLVTVERLERRLENLENKPIDNEILTAQQAMADSILTLQTQVNLLQAELKKIVDPENDLFNIRLKSKTPIHNVALLKERGVLPIKLNPDEKRKFIQVFFVIEDFVTLEIVRDDNPYLKGLGIFE